MSEFCIHYPRGGMGMNDICEKGVDMRPWKPANVEAPCYNDKVGGCPFAEYPTAEQIAERNKHIAAYLESMANLMQGKSDVCPQCEQKINQLEQVGRCVYAHPCGHRLYQGRLPKGYKPGASSI